jgi:hypothetical protein
MPVSDGRYPQVEQMDPYYCFDTGTDIECYWYLVSDVVVAGWVDRLRSNVAINAPRRLVKVPVTRPGLLVVSLVMV